MESQVLTTRYSGKYQREIMKSYIKHAAIVAATLGTWHVAATNYTSLINYCQKTIEARYYYTIESLAERSGFKRAETSQESISLTDQAIRSALRHNLNPSLFSALVNIESASNPYAVSPVGALGLAQVMPANAKRCNLSHPGKLMIPESNLDCGAQILSEELKRYGGNLVEALQAYNGGPKCVYKCTESINYSRKVLARLARDIGPSSNPSERITDSDRQELTILINKVGNEKKSRASKG